MSVNYRYSPANGPGRSVEPEIRRSEPAMGSRLTRSIIGCSCRRFHQFPPFNRAFPPRIRTNPHGIHSNGRRKRTNPWDIRSKAGRKRTNDERKRTNRASKLAIELGKRTIGAAIRTSTTRGHLLQARHSAADKLAVRISMGAYPSMSCPSPSFNHNWDMKRLAQRTRLKNHNTLVP
jgi:hypothetical protein